MSRKALELHLVSIILQLCFTLRFGRAQSEDLEQHFNALPLQLFLLRIEDWEQMIFVLSESFLALRIEDCLN